MFLTPPSRRPYELCYFCRFADDVFIVTDNDTFSKYSDSFSEFKDFNFRLFFVSTITKPISKFLRLGSTAALITYDEMQLAKLISDKKITTIISVEIFSSLSEQASRLSDKFSLRHIVIVWENIKRSIFYLVPPFSTNSRIVKSTAAKFVAVSDKSKQSISSLEIQKDKIVTIYPGILVDKFRESTDCSDKILFVGNLEPNKGITILLEAFEKLSISKPGARLLIVGRGTLESKINKLKNCGLKVEYNGYVSRLELASVYSKCGIFCSPSVPIKKAGLILTWQEQFGFTLVEAMASGLPIVSSNTGAIPEIVGEDNLTVSPNSENVLYALELLLSSEVLRKKLRQKNRDRTISKFNALKQSSLFEKAINE
jgi:glycosyltransferase involved in cell wall biosynthesis